MIKDSSKIVNQPQVQQIAQQQDLVPNYVIFIEHHDNEYFWFLKPTNYEAFYIIGVTKQGNIYTIQEKTNNYFRYQRVNELRNLNEKKEVAQDDNNNFNLFSDIYLEKKVAIFKPFTVKTDGLTYYRCTETVDGKLKDFNRPEDALYLKTLKQRMEKDIINEGCKLNLKQFGVQIDQLSIHKRQQKNLQKSIGSAQSQNKRNGRYIKIIMVILFAFATLFGMWASFTKSKNNPQRLI